MLDYIHHSFDKIVSNPFFIPVSTIIIVILTFMNLLLIIVQMIINHRKSRADIAIVNQNVSNFQIFERTDIPRQIYLSINFDIRNESELNNTIKAIEYILEDVGKKSSSRILPFHILDKTLVGISENVEFPLHNQAKKSKYKLIIKVVDQYNNFYFATKTVSFPNSPPPRN